MKNLQNKFKEMNKYEDNASKLGYINIAGVDEVGRGPLAGPLVVAGVILNTVILGLDDSKKLSKKKIEELSTLIKESAKKYVIIEISVSLIEE